MMINVPLEMIAKNPWQTRLSVDPEHIKDLAEDIAANGLLQTPLGRLAYIDGAGLSLAEMSTVTLSEKSIATLPGRGIVLQLAFGHNRFEAYRLNLEARGGGWGRMPVEIRVLSDEQMADYAWSENERRQDLSPIERAQAIQKRIEHFHWTQEQVADRLRLNRSTVANILRLLNLPENLQAKLGDGLTERSAIALLSLFALPEFIRQEAEKQIEYPWNDEARKTKPSCIVADALAGEPSDRIRSRIDELIKKFGEKLSGAPWKYGDDFQQLLEGIDLPENLSLGALRSFACSACELRHDTHICLDRDCFAIKMAMWRIVRLHQASQASGIPYLDHEEARRYPRSELNDYYAREFTQQIIASKCENLRLIYASDIDKRDRDGLEGFSNVRVICQKRSGSCACIQGIQAQQRAAEARFNIVEEPDKEDEPTTLKDDLPNILASTSPVEMKVNGVLNPGELEEKARAARRAKRESFGRIPAIKEEFANILAGELRQFNPRIWRDVVRRVYWKAAEGLDGKTSDIEQIAQVLGIALVEMKAPTGDYLTNSGDDPAGMVRRYLERYLTEIGHQVDEEAETPA